MLYRQVECKLYYRYKRLRKSGGIH